MLRLTLAAIVAALIIPVTAFAYLGDPGGGGAPICSDWNIGADYYANGHHWVCTFNPYGLDYWRQVS